jgi:hypothetical protein
VFGFKGVHDIVVDGLQFNDPNIDYANKRDPAPTTSAFLLGEYTNGSSSDPLKRKSYVTDFIVKNCYMSGLSYGFASVAAIDSKITNNTIVNLKSTTDTAGTNDVMAGAIEACNGYRLEISYNYIKGAWAKSGRISSTGGLGGVAIDAFNLKYSKIIYNTIIDCGGFIEFGNIDRTD